MDANELVHLGQAYATLAEYYGRPLDDLAITLYLEDLCDLPFDGVIYALKALRREPKRRAVPLPSEVRSKLCDGASGQDGLQPVQLAAKIIGAISKFGYTQPEAARAYIGDLGWAVIDRASGWTSLCQTTHTRDLGTLHAQLREQLRVEIDQKAAQTFTALPATHGAKAMPETV